MQKKTCPKCGTENPDGNAQYCFECGNPFPKPDLMDSSLSQASKLCRKCKISNPPRASFCYKCGTPLDDVQPSSDICPTCGITVDQSKLFCPNCGQSLIKAPLEFEPEPDYPVKTVSPRVECPACGQLTTGEYCRNCGYRLTLKQKKRPIDWWYCDRDSAIMVEINPNLQIPVSRTSIDESLAQALDNHLLQQQDRKEARQLALQLFEEGSTTNFEVLTPVKCPACGKQSLAPITRKPQDPGFRYFAEIALNAGAILRNGIFYFRSYPRLLLILLSAILADAVLIIIGLSPISILDPNVFLVSISFPSTGVTGYYELDLASYLVFLLISAVISITLSSFIQCWYCTSLKEIRKKNEVPLDLGESFKDTFRFIPRAVAARLSINIGTVILIVGVILIFLLVGGGFIYGISGPGESPFYGAILFLLLLFLVVLGGILVVGFLISILFAYVNMSIVFDETGVILSLRRSWRFARYHFWTTVGVILIFSFLPVVMGVFSGSSLLFFGVGPLTSLISAISSRLIEAYQSVSLGWGYDEFKHVID